MSDRSDVRFDEIGAIYATFKGDGSTITYDSTKVGGSSQVGLAATFSADNTVALTADGNAVVGKVSQVYSDGFVRVQIGGYMTLPAGDSATVTRGKAIVGDLGASSAKGYIRDVDTATAAELGVAVGQIYNVGDTANVGVMI